jgi:hypothetical protein
MDRTQDRFELSINQQDGHSFVAATEHRTPPPQLEPGRALG